jgi:hypothetical protein
MSINNLVGNQPLQTLGISSPLSGSSARDTPVVIEIYALGIGVRIKGQGGDLLAGQSAFELEANGKIFVFNPLFAKKANGLVVPIQGDIAPVGLKIKAVDKNNLTQLGHGETPFFKTVILSLPQGAGKSTIADQLAARLRCSHIVDEWDPGLPIYSGALHLTNINMTT